MPFMNGTEWLIVVALAFLLLGDRMPEYAQRLARLVWQLREKANEARSQLKEQLGPEFDDINWRQYDPRQYDPRRIVREALQAPPASAVPGAAAGAAAGLGAAVVGSPFTDAAEPLVGDTGSPSADKRPDAAIPTGSAVLTRWDIEAT